MAKEIIKGDSKYMKATGIVRRIDELGRVVIPKEIRRTLRIREGDPLEIYTERQGGVILKKYSPIGELNEFADDFAAAIGNALNKTSIVCDKDVVISVNNSSKKEYVGKPISRELEETIEKRTSVINNGVDGEKCIPIVSGENNENINAQVIVPIISDGQTIGAVVVLSKDAKDKFSELEQKTAEVAASFLGAQMVQ